MKRQIRGLHHIRTSTGSPPRSFTPRRPSRSSIPPREGRFLGSGFSKAQNQPRDQRQNKKQPWTRINLPPPPKALKVQKSYKSTIQISQVGDCINVLIQLPRELAEVVKLSVKGDILSIQAATSDIKFDTECLLPIKIQSPLIDSSYSEETLHIKICPRNKAQA